MHFFFFFKSFNFQPMASAPNNNSISSDQDINWFLVLAGLNLRSLIQPSETLPIEL